MALPQIVRRILETRGVVGDKAIARFLNPSLADLAAASDLPGVSEAAAAMLPYVRDHRRIVVFGDYDCDGVCASAIMVTALRTLGADVSAFIPRRLGEGYGMSDASVGRMLAENPTVSMVVTVDNGINSIRHVAELKARGVAVIVTDHHLPGDELPDCIVVNPKATWNPLGRAPVRLDGLCGAGVSFFLSRALVDLARKEGVYDGPKISEPLLVMAGLATVTDVMPLVGQNRILVTEAMRRFANPDIPDSGSARRGAPVGLRELFARAGRTGRGEMTSKDFGFAIGPRINAVGRLEQKDEKGRVAGADRALELLLCGVTPDERERARALAAEIDTANVRRKTFETAMSEIALEQIVPGASAQVIAFDSRDERVHPGVSGIVAARILEHLERSGPVCVLVDGKGSARAPAGYNLRDALAQSAEFLERFGGHAAAAGLTVRADAIDMFRERLCAVAARQAATIPPELRDSGRCDAILSTEELRPDAALELAGWMRRLEPFGEGNPEPVFALRGAMLTDVRPLGAEGRHLQVSFGRNIPRAVWWGRGDLVGRLRAEAARPHDATFTLEISDYGERHAELRLVSISCSDQNIERMTAK